MPIKERQASHFSKSKQVHKTLAPPSKTTKVHQSDSSLTMAKNATKVVGKPAAILEGDGGWDMLIQPVYITWTEKDGRLGLMRQWTNVQIINNEAFVNPRVDIELLWQIEWGLKEVDEKRDGKWVDEKKTEPEEKEPKV